MLIPQKTFQNPFTFLPITGTETSVIFSPVTKLKTLTAKFVMTGDYARWKQVAKKELDATKALMQGKLKFKGDLTYVVRHVKVVNKVIDLLTEVNTVWPDDV